MSRSHARPARPRRPFWTLAILLLALSMACSMPAPDDPTPTPIPRDLLFPETPAPATTPTQQPLPPALVESDPPAGAALPLNGAVRLYFNQPMDQESVEAVLASGPGVEGRLTWQDPATLEFRPRQPLDPESQFMISVDTEARSAAGLALQEPISLTFQTAGYLELAQALPEPETTEVDPAAAIVAAFNRPAAPLGGDPREMMRPVFSLEPEAAGRGEWLNTSTYIFYPDPPLDGGQTYTVTLRDDLRSVDGSPLEEPISWSFTTALPEVVSIVPEPGSTGLGLDQEVIITFNQAMDTEGTAEVFQLAPVGGSAVAGDFAWSEGDTVLTFTPAELLARNTAYLLTIDDTAQARGGTPLSEPVAVNYQTVPELSVSRTDPAPGGEVPQYSSPALYFSSPVSGTAILDHISMEPDVPGLNGWWADWENSFHLQGFFDPSTAYTLTLSAGLTDPWGSTISEPFTYTFRTAPVEPGLFIQEASQMLFLPASESGLAAQGANLPEVTLTVERWPLERLFSTWRQEASFESLAEYQPVEGQTWAHSLGLPPNTYTPVELPLSPDRQPLAPGVYFFRMDWPGNDEASIRSYLLSVSHIHLVFKSSATDALLWATDLRDGSPAADTPVAIYDGSGSLLLEGRTDAEGIFFSSFPQGLEAVDAVYAVLGEPGDENFSLGYYGWNAGVTSYDFGIQADFRGPQLKTYIYTDRPVYRPGQTVYFRVVARQAHNGRYEQLEASSLPVEIVQGFDQVIASFDLPLSSFGTAHGEFTLPENSQPGAYHFKTSTADFANTFFEVAEYRKPEIDLQVAFEQEEILAVEVISATVEARYFFDAPAGDVPVQWSLYALPEPFDLPGYSVGPQQVDWLRPGFNPALAGFLGEYVTGGEARTGPDGRLALELPGAAAETMQDGVRRRLTLEVTAQDESGLPVSGRASLVMNPAEFHIGLQPEAWLGEEGQPSGFSVQVVDWDGEPAGAHALQAAFQKVVWERQEPDTPGVFAWPVYVPRYTPVATTDFMTSEGGQARLAFTPPEPGTYQVSVQGEGARTEIIYWVSGAGQAVFPSLPSQRLNLQADRGRMPEQAYLPGETAEIFIPNPYGAEAQALVTVERGTVLRHEVISIPGSGAAYSLPLTDADAPNVYLSVTLLGAGTGGYPDFHTGYLPLFVEPEAFQLNVSLASEPQRAAPGDEVTIEILATDAAGDPVEAEFSISLVDLAVLALEDPNAPDILPAFYGRQLLGVQSGIGLAAYPRRDFLSLDGTGGGGEGDGSPAVRENFPDTAYWNAQVVTGPDGRAKVQVTLPDSLTTWQVQARGLTADTVVGQAEAEIVTRKELLVRPVTPRFLVAGDHVQLGAVIQNNTEAELQAQVELQASGAALDDPEAASQQVNVPAGGRARVDWWATVQDVDEVDLVFSAEAGALQDAARPEAGRLPVLRFTTPNVFRTAGVLDAGGQRLELVSLPRSLEGLPLSGRLDVELSPSLAAAVLQAFENLETFPEESTESTVSRFLPALEAYSALQTFELESDVLDRQIEGTLTEGLLRLSATQNPDGGWGWWPGGESDPYQTAYVLLGLSRAQAAGADVQTEMMAAAVAYLQEAGRPETEASPEPWELDRMALVRYALAEAGEGSADALQGLYEEREVMAPWSRALLALAFEKLSPGSQESRTLISNLKSEAVRSATGAHWALDRNDWQNMVTPLSTSSVVVYALAQRDPGSPLLADAVRYLMANRSPAGAWPSTYATAWSLMAVTATVRGTGELGGAYAFSASLNGSPIASGQAEGIEQLTPVAVEIPLEALYPDAPNALTIEREEGQGRLYYTAGLTVNRPVDEAPAVDRGLYIERTYELASDPCPEGICQPVSAVPAGEPVRVRLTLVVPEDAYYLAIEDHIPAGTEILNRSLKTSQLGFDPFAPVEPVEEEQLEYDPLRPFDEGWGWWYFGPEQVYDDRITWSADYLPAGTYELTYTLVTLQPGEYRVLPARAWQVYFPEVYGHSAGAVFAVTP